MKARNLLEKGIPVSLLNSEAKKEKYASPPIVNLHKFSTRKPLITSRMVVAGGILNEKSINKKESFNKLLGIDPKLRKRAYKNIPFNLIKKISEQYPNGVTIFDPFAGAGTIPFEALRLGLDVVALDYNPVAYLIMKGTIEYPLKYGSIIDETNKKRKLYSDVDKYSKIIYNKLKEELSIYYPKHNNIEPKTYFHSWAVKCPICGNITPLLNNWILDERRNIVLQYEIKGKEIIYKIVKSNCVQEGNVYRGKGTCLFCSSEISNDYLVEDISTNEREILLAVYLDNGDFVLPKKEDTNSILQTKKYLKDHIKELREFIPNEVMPNDRRAIPAKKYLKYWYKLFNSRQLLVLAKLAKEIKGIIDEISPSDRNYAAAIGTYLSMILSRHLTQNTRGAHWQSNRTTIQNILALRGISMMWDHPEVNPFVKTSGSLINNIMDVLKGLNFAIQTLNPTSLDTNLSPKINIYNSSILSWQTEKKFQFIVTDPPYYDDVPYPELFQYFQVWHSRTVGDLLNIPAIPSTGEELSVNQSRSEHVFEYRMFIAFKKIFNLLTNDGILVMFYAHKSIDGWKFVIETLRKAGFKVTSSITLMTESESSVLTRGKSSVFHSLVITARKRLESRKANILDVEEEIRRKMEERYSDLVEVYGKDRLNLMVAASGIVIETITSYSEITSFTKNTADYALEMGQRYLIELFAKNTLNVDRVDPKTMVYTWFRHSPLETIDYSEFNQTLKALGISEEMVADIIHRRKGKREQVELLDFSERGALEIDGMEPLVAQSVIDAVHIALRSYLRGGISSAKNTIQSSPFGSQAVLNTIDALAKLPSIKTSYDEGKTCKRFQDDWRAQEVTPRPLHDYAE